MHTFSSVLGLAMTSVGMFVCKKKERGREER